MLELIEYAVVYKVFRNGNAFFFAFVVDEDGNKTDEKLFCHYNDYRAPERFDREVTWCRQGITQDNGFHWPKEGDSIVFERGTNDKGAKALRWCYTRQAHLAHHGVDATTYVIRTEDDIVLWRGGYNPDFPEEPIVTYFGSFPRRLPAEFQLFMEVYGDVEVYDFNIYHHPHPDMWDALLISLEIATYRPA